MRPLGPCILVTYSWTERDLKQNVLMQWRCFLESRGQWRWPVSGQDSGPPTQQPKRVSLCLSVSHTSLHDTFCLNCHLKSCETTDLIQCSNFIDEETEVPERVGDTHAFSTGVSWPLGLPVPETSPCYKWRQQRVENNGETLLSFHTVLPTRDIPRKTKPSVVPPPHGSVIGVLVYEWQEHL